jgi:hypothetical protein
MSAGQRGKWEPCKNLVKQVNPANFPAKAPFCQGNSSLQLVLDLAQHVDSEAADDRLTIDD